MPKQSYIITLDMTEAHSDTHVMSQLREHLPKMPIWKGIACARKAVLIRKATVRPLPNDD